MYSETAQNKGGLRVSILLNNISTIRKAKGIKQYQLASMLGIERTALSGIENGRYDASPKTMKTISDIFQKPIGEIFFNPDVQ